MAYGYYLEAEYESGYVHREDEQDASPFVHGKNILYDIINKLPEDAHGRLVRFGLVGPEKTYNIDFRAMPADAKPIYYRNVKKTWNSETGEILNVDVKHFFGYEFHDSDNKKQKEIMEI